MLRSYWLPYIALIGILIGAGGVAAQPIRNDAAGQTSAAKAQDKPQNDITPLALRSIQDAINRLTNAYIAEQNKPKPAAEQQASARDLKAQEDMAYWAKLMFWAAGAEALLTFVGVILVWRTLIYTKHAAEAAQETVAATREIGDLQLRAYVSIESVEAAFSIADDGEIVLSIKIVFKNTGQTPAISTLCDAELGIVKDILVVVTGKSDVAHQTISSGGVRIFAIEWKVKTEHFVFRDRTPYALFQLNVRHGYLDYRKRKWMDNFEYRCPTSLKAPMKIAFLNASGHGLGEMEKKWGG